MPLYIQCIFVFHKYDNLNNKRYYYQSSGFWVEFKKDIYNEDYLKSLNLNSRQIRAVLYTRENEKITNSEYQAINETSNRTASRDLTELVEKGIFESSGSKGAGSFYSLK